MWSGTHKVAQMTPVREDLGLLLHPNPGWHFTEAHISLLSDNRLKNDFIHLKYWDVKLKKIVL
jgi:hypothetical protein